MPARPQAALFLEPSSGRPFHAAKANLMLRSALTAAGFKEACAASFHSLCQSGAQACARAGLPSEQVQRHGLWRSSAIRAYVPRHLASTSRVLSKELSNDA